MLQCAFLELSNRSDSFSADRSTNCRSRKPKIINLKIIKPASEGCWRSGESDDKCAWACAGCRTWRYDRCTTGTLVHFLLFHFLCSLPPPRKPFFQNRSLGRLVISLKRNLPTKNSSPKLVTTLPFNCQDCGKGEARANMELVGQNKTASVNSKFRQCGRLILLFE